MYETLRLLAANGWRQSGRSGDMRLLSHPSRPGVKVLVYGKLSEPIAGPVFAEILRSAGLDEGSQ